MDKSYSELITIPSFEERIRYLQTGNRVGDNTFGAKRYLNQLLYSDPSWKAIRKRAILRDSDGSHILDLAHPDYPLYEAVYVHHINPITMEDILDSNPKIFDLNNLITCSFNTHQSIHYGNPDGIKTREFVIRKPNDTSPWR